MITSFLVCVGVCVCVASCLCVMGEREKGRQNGESQLGLFWLQRNKQRKEKGK
uniref:Uncharacterized protein n=1 Tax=Rhizophora mucronata TaxID=61149 RepID=A0A2P2PJL4_RHIMU